MTRPDDTGLDQLLAGGHLGGPEHERILREVLARTVPSRSPWRRPWFRRTVASGAVLAAALGAWILIPRLQTTGFHSKGAGDRVDVGLGVACASSGREVCRPDDTLMFKVNAAVVSGYLGAYAQRVDDPAHARIWYFPSPARSAPRVAPGDGTRVLPEGIRIGPEHRPGRYQVTVWIADRPFGYGDREGVAEGAVHGRGSFFVDVVP